MSSNSSCNPMLSSSNAFRRSSAEVVRCSSLLCCMCWISSLKEAISLLLAFTISSRIRTLERSSKTSPSEEAKSFALSLRSASSRSRADRSSLRRAANSSSFCLCSKGCLSKNIILSSKKTVPSSGFDGTGKSRTSVARAFPRSSASRSLLVGDDGGLIVISSVEEAALGEGQSAASESLAGAIMGTSCRSGDVSEGSEAVVGGSEDSSIESSLAASSAPVATPLQSLMQVPNMPSKES
mmetsp:Transcript_63031/g.111988  ORF Transcript_63031/g.111988 Transcript_63031/m.111988 type:complete len:239 (-) Transcript_63031:476-1192(-)